jgi:hypothetical protein
VVKKPSILLGETKYFYATEDNGNLTILETTDHVLGNGGLSDATFDDPVAATGSEKNAVYWEDEYPTYSGHTLTGTERLPAGMVRLIGRYWEEAKTFKSTLTVHRADHSTSIDIEVKKPKKLGDDYGEIRPGVKRTSVRDVFGNKYNLDSLLIISAGRQGIPPQILKADIETESHFQPGYRWEPFVDANIQRHSDSLKFMDDDFRYKKTINPNREGEPGIPTDHANVSPTPYPRNDYSTIWNRFFARSSTLNSGITPGATNDVYPIAFWWSFPASEWKNRYKARYDEVFSLETDEGKAKIEATDFANEYLRDEYQNGVMSEGISQTRTAASYGVMQMLYTTAVGKRHYPFDRVGGEANQAYHLPEYINITDTNLVYAVPYLRDRVGEELDHEGDGRGKPDNWTLGFERTMIVGLNMYNGQAYTKVSKNNPNTRYNWHYGFDVLENVFQYLPGE